MCRLRTECNIVNEMLYYRDLIKFMLSELFFIQNLDAGLSATGCIHPHSPLHKKRLLKVMHSKALLVQDFTNLVYIWHKHGRAHHFAVVIYFSFIFRFLKLKLGLEMAAPLEACQKQRAVIEFLLAEEETPPRIHIRLKNVHKDNTIDYSNVKRRIQQLKKKC